MIEQSDFLEFMMQSVLNNIIFDSEGFMIDAESWSPDIGRAIAADLKIELGPKHWQVINFAREDFTLMGEAPSLRRITDQSGIRTKDLFDMFAGNPSKKVAKIAGLPKPPGCI